MSDSVGILCYGTYGTKYHDTEVATFSGKNSSSSHNTGPVHTNKRALVTGNGRQNIHEVREIV